MRIARAFPNATVLAVEESEGATNAHLANVTAALAEAAASPVAPAPSGALGNDAVCRGPVDKKLMLNLCVLSAQCNMMQCNVV